MANKPTGDHCVDCGTYHGKPNPCGYNQALFCRGCGKPRGPRWSADDGTTHPNTAHCWACWWRGEMEAA